MFLPSNSSQDASSNVANATTSLCLTNRYVSCCKKAGCYLVVFSTLRSSNTVGKYFGEKIASRNEIIFFFFFFTELKEAAVSAPFGSACQIGPMGPAPLSSLEEESRLWKTQLEISPRLHLDVNVQLINTH